MRNSFLFFASAAALVAVGCSKLSVTAPSAETAEGEICELKLSLNGGLATKVTDAGSAKENKIQNVQVFVFRAGSDDASSVLDACLAEGFETELNKEGTHSTASLKCTTGEKHIYVIVNADANYTADAGIGTLTDLLSKTMKLSAMRADKLLMIGSARSVKLGYGIKFQEIKVVRACASVILKSIKNDMQAAVYQKAGSFKIKDIYLTNVPAIVNFGQTALASSLVDADSWYARLKAETDPGKKALIHDAQTATVLEYGNTDASVHTFYTFPNNCTDISSGIWCQRATRLVIEATYNDGGNWHDCYYPIILHRNGLGLDANKQYIVNLTINRPGSNDPDVPVMFYDLTGTISVEDWAEGTSYTETI